MRTGRAKPTPGQGQDDQLILTEYLKELFLVGYINLVETITFADGTNWSYLKLLQHYVDIAKTDGNDTIYGFEGISDSIDGGLGNDRLEGLSGNDRYVFGRNYGTDTILDESGEDRIQFKGIASTEITFSRTALDLIMTVTATGERIVLENQYVRDGQQHFAVEYFEFTDRTLVFTDFNPEDMDLVGTNAAEEITGSNFAETLDGRGGNDTLIGGDGGDTYKFDVGYGQDVIIDRRVRAHWSDRKGFKVPVNDVVVLGDDITLANIVFTKSGDDSSSRSETAPTRFASATISAAPTTRSSASSSATAAISSPFRTSRKSSRSKAAITATTSSPARSRSRNPGRPPGR